MRSGFTLVELSIVLVIIGLVTGGIMMGQNLIRNAEVKSVLTEYARYKQAANQFKEKYFSVPGDMMTATDVWGTSAACSGSDALGVCNGNGDGHIDNTPAGQVPTEPLQFWRHLVAAGFLNGTYSGVSGADTDNDHEPGVNCPKSAVDGGAWSATYLGWTTNVSNFFDGYYGTILTLGEQNVGGYPRQASLTPKEARDLDSKIDDGMPATGRVVATQRAPCTTAQAALADSSDFGARYNLSRSDLRCSLTFRQIFRTQLLQ